jgi:hypothetical protein
VCTRAVSALAHYLEEEGIATVAISLIRPQTEKTKPPRALWVPFELGRPFGPANQPQFQKRVILAALQLLEQEHGPVIIEDFPDDDPRAQPDRSWHPPRGSIAPVDRSPETLAARLEAEIPLLRDAHEQWRAQHGRTTVGLCALPITQCARYIAEWLRGHAPPSMRDGFSAPLMLRFALDDLKAYYLEAAAAGASKPSSQQLGDWLWNETATGAAILALREACLTSEDERLRLIAGNFMVPAARVPSTG